jgi:hypothetical protein
MAFSLARWRPRHLLLAWAAYWLVLLAVVTRPVLGLALAALTGPQGHGSIGVSMDNTVLKLSVKSDALAYTGSASMLSIALWIAGPPLLLWVIWMATRTRPQPAHERIS